MKFARASGTLGLVALAVIASPFAVAQDSRWLPHTSRLYGGINIGQSRADFDYPRMTSSLLGPAFTTTSITDDDRDTGYKLYGGYRFHRNFAVEGGYFNLGKFGFTANVVTTAPPRTPGTLNGNIKVHGLNLDLVGILPITERFSAFGRLGLTNAKTRDSFSGTGAVLGFNPNPSKRDTNYKFGAGLQYDFTPSLGVRLEAERYRIHDAVSNRGDIDLYSIGLVYRFGGRTPVPAPRPAVYTPPPPPPPVVTPPPPPRVVTPPPPPAVYTPPPAPAPAPAPRRRDRE